MKEPKVSEMFADNGEHSHWQLVDENGEILWSEEPTEVKNNAVLPLVSNSALQDNSKLVDNMCMSYRHDFGLMAEQDKQSLRFECKEWLRAYENNREHCC